MVPNDLAFGVPIEFDPNNRFQNLGELGVTETQVVSFVANNRKRLEESRVTKKSIWNECWRLYRGKEDFSDKEDWQSKVSLPKSWNSVKQATNAIMRFLQAADHPWTIDPVNPDDAVTAIRAGQMTDLTKVFVQNSEFFRAFGEGLESGFITGIGIWKLWWELEPKLRMEVQNAIDEQSGQLLKNIVRREVLEGRLQMRAVDPYNFYWLRGSTFNRWVGTIEKIEVSKWILKELAAKGLFDPEIVEKVQPKKSPTVGSDNTQLRFAENDNARTGSPGSGEDTVELTEYYGPLLDEKGGVIVRNAHAIIANDTHLLLVQENNLWTRKPPYVAFSPLLLPFRTEGVGIIEMNMGVDKALNQLARMGMDKLMFNLLPIFEASVDIFEDPTELETGLIPGKVLRKGIEGINTPGLQPIQTPDISAGMLQMAGILDRAHQEGSLISEIQQSIPRFRGQQTLGEIEIKQGNQVDFLSALARDIDVYALKPIVEMSMELIMQFLDTSNDPRVGKVLGIGAEVFRGMNKVDILDMLQGDYNVVVSGITDQTKKAEQLQNIVQFMNIIGQNPDAWLPYVRQDQLLYRILEALRPGIRDIENIMEDPITVAAKQDAMRNSKLTPEIIRVMPQIIQLASSLNAQSPDGVNQFAEKVAPQVDQVIQQEQAAAEEARQKQEQLEDATFRAQIAQLERIARGEA